MNPEAKEELERILALNPEELTAHDIKFLNARRDYLNKEQRRVFASKLVDEDAPDILNNLNQDGVNEPASAKPEAPKGTEAPTASPATETPVTSPSVPTRKELSDQAIALGVDGDLVKKAKTNADIQALIDNADPNKAPVQPTQPETSAPALDPFAGTPADPDARV